jgi:hypothetical protein
MMNNINSTGNLTYARMPDNDEVLLMGDNSDMESDLKKGETFDIQRIYFDANYVFDVIPQEVEALLTAIAAITKCSKTWFFCKGTPQDIIKAATGDAKGVKPKDILNIFQLLQQVANDQFVKNFKDMLDCMARSRTRPSHFVFPQQCSSRWNAQTSRKY